MKLEVKPEILEVVKRQGVTGRNAGRSRDGQISWIYNAGFLEVTLCETNETLATWRFGKVLRDTNTIITCMADLTYGGDHYLVIATNSFTDLGTINIFSLGLRKVIRAIEIPQRVTALDVVFTNTNEDVPEWILSKHLQFFSGLVAVGTETGYVYLVDLCLDDLMVNHSTEATPKKLTVVSPGIVDPKAKREQAKLYDRHLAVLLDDQSHKQGHFYYRRQDDNIEKVLDEDTVTVTSIKYLSQAGTLAVGFNFGSFQLWRLYNPVLDYSSRFSSHGVAISHFVVQEPENDPRNFVYLWVGHDDLTVDSISNVCLYQLSFTKKHVYPGFGMFYDELESVCARLDHKLTLDPYSSDLGTTICSSIVDCYTLVNPYYTPPSKLSDSFDEGLHSNDLSLSVFVWRAESKRTGGATKHWMCIFDLNRWYHAQMPHSLRCHGSSIQVCSYWVACNLDEVVSLTSATDSLLGVAISGDKVLRFINNSALPPEEHSYPSALQLTDIQFIKSDCTIRAKCDGWQGQLLCQLAHHGAQLLVQPADFYHQCHRARLLPQNYEEMRTNTADYQRAMLLNMALEHGITSTLVPQCIQQWADGEFAEQGCTLSFLLDWAWSRVVIIKQLWDAACEMLYDWSGHHLDSRTDRQLESLTESLASLKQIFSALVMQSSPTTERGEIEMDLRQDVINILLLHCNAVRWCVSFNLLPETDEASDPLPGMFSYPFNSLRESYTKKRAELSTRKGIVKDFSLLLIDDLIDCQGPHINQMWKTLGGDGLYPPPNMQAVVNMYLIEEVSAAVKHAVTLYLLQDLAALTKHEASEMVITSFIQRFMLSPGLVHQIQGLWFIDHRDFEEGVRHLVNPNIHEDLGGSWKHVAVINSLLAQSEGKAATRYLHTKGVLGASPQEQQLYISVLLNNRQVSQALDYMRGCQNENNSALLLDHLLNECHKYKLLGHLLQLSLSESEEMHLEQYLRARAEPHALEPLFLYYLHHSRFLQAFQLNEDMKKMDRLETSLVAQERAATRNRLMEAYLKVLPDVACKLLMEKQRGCAVAAKRVEVSRPKPLSTKVHSSDHVAMSRSHFVMAVLEKVTEAENVAASEAADAPEDHMTKAASESRSSIPFLSTPRTPRQKAYPRASEVIYSGLKLSPLATNPLSVVKRNLTIDSKQEQQNGNISLRQLTEECLQLLQTPVRSHKRQSIGSSMAATVSHVKTPQSILKVQRLSKTLLPTPKEKSSAKRSSAPRALRLAFSSDHSLQASPTKSSSGETTAASAPLLASSENTTVKQLRFVGVSPSPTPSPTVKPEFSLDRSKEVIDTEQTPASWDQDMDSPEVVPQDAIWTASEQSSAYLSETSVRTPLSERSRPESSTKVLPVTGQTHSSVQELSESFTNEMTRGDLHSSWKQGQLLGHSDEAFTSASTTSCPTSSVSITSAPRLSQQEVVEVGSMQRGRDCHTSTSCTEIVEETTSSHAHRVLTASFSQEVVKTTTRYTPLSVDTELSSSRIQETSVHTSQSDSKRNLSPLLISPGHNQRLWKSSSMSPRSVQTGVIASQATTSKSPGRNLSPPITPPSSKKARLLESRAKELGLSRKSTLFTSSPDKSETEEPLRRKTPTRRSPSSQSDYEELPRKSPTRRSPSRQSDYEELPRTTPTRRSPSRQSNYEELPRKTPTQRSPSEQSNEELPRKTPTRRSASRQSDYEEMQRKTPTRRSPSRKTKQPTEQTVNVELQRETLETKPPPPKLHEVEGRIDEGLQRKTLERTSPLRKMRKLEDYGGLETARKITERKSPARKVQVQEEIELDVDKDVSHSKRSLRRTPDRQSVTRKMMVISESDDGRQSRESEDTLVPMTADADDVKEEDVFREAEDVLGKLSAADASPEVPERRRSARLKTPDRAATEALSLEPLTPARGHGRVHRTPQRESQKQANDNKAVEMEGKPSPSRRSTRKRVLSETIEENKLELVTSSVSEQTVESVSEQTVEIVTSPGKQSSTQNEEEKEETEVHSVRRSRRQSKTPDRLVAKDNTLEPLTPTRKSRRLQKTIAEEPESVKTSGKSPVKVSQEGAPSMKQDLPGEKPESLKVPSVPADRPNTRSRTPEHGSAEGVEPVILSVSSRRPTKMKIIKESEEADLTSQEGERDQTKEKTLRSRKITPDNVQDTSIEEPKRDADESIIGSAKSPGRSRQSPARQTKSPGRQTKSPGRQTKSPARQTKSPARETKSPARETKSPARQTRSRADDVKTSELKEDYGWSEEMPALRLEVEDDVDNEKDGIRGETDTAKIKAIEIHRETTLQKPDLTTSEDPLLPSTPARLTRAGKSHHEQALTKSFTPSFVFSPPLKHSEHDEDINQHLLAAAADEEKPLFVFSHPTVAEDTGASVETDAAETGPESKEKPQEETKQKRKKKRTLLSYSPILLSPHTSPVSSRKSQKHRLDSLRLASGRKLRVPPTRRIKPSTWTQPTTSRQ